MGLFTGVPVLVLLLLSLVVCSNASLFDLFTTWSSSNVRWLADGKSATITLDQASAAGCTSKDSYVFGKFGAYIKLPPFDSAGTVTTFYLSSPFPNQSEFDLEFLGNKSGQPFLLHTNVFTNGQGGREQQIYLPGGFDPTAAFHYYSFEWTADIVVFRVDNHPVREFKNLVGKVANFTFCTQKPMKLFFSIWDGSKWATRGGQDPVNYADAPFTATYTDFSLDGCYATGPSGAQACQSDSLAHCPPLTAQDVDYLSSIRYNPAQVKYNYCDDRNRYLTAPPECAYNAM
jgi:xyloglucan:xyloglucosyl transferase